MNQREINEAFVYLLRGVVNELRRGVPSHSWGQDMVELPKQLDRLERAIGMVVNEAEENT